MLTVEEQQREHRALPGETSSVLSTIDDHMALAADHTALPPSRPFASRLSQSERRRAAAARGSAAPAAGTAHGNTAPAAGTVQARAPPPLVLASAARARSDCDSRGVCRHFLADGCLRSDCPFLHDTREQACRYWASPEGCAAGGACAFRHDVQGLGVDIRSLSGGAGEESPRAGGEEGQLRQGGEAGEAGEAEGELEDLEWMLPYLVEGSGEEGLEEGGAARQRAAAPAGPPLDVADRAAFPALRWRGGAGGEAEGLGGGGGGGGEGGEAAGVAEAPLAEALRAALLAGRPGGEAAAGGRQLWGDAAPGGPAPPARCAWGAQRSDHFAAAVLARAFPGLPRGLLEAALSRARGGGGGGAGAGGGAGGAAAVAMASAAAPPRGGDLLLDAARLLSLETRVAPVAGVLQGMGRPRCAARGGGAAAAPSAAAATARGIAASLARVSTGGAVASLYAAARGGAEALAKARNLALHRATRAYLAGDGAGAARWGREGRALSEQMRAAHAQAAAAIFAARNAGGAGAAGPPAPAHAHAPAPAPAHTHLPPPTQLAGVPVHVFDLHGLHPSEAVAVGEGCAAAAARSSGSRAADGGVWLAFLTGTRSHSQRLGKGGGSIHAALAEALAALAGAELFDPPAAGGGGVLVLHMHT